MKLSEAEGRALLAKFPGAKISKSAGECLRDLEAKQPAKGGTAPKPRRKQAGREMTATERRYGDFLDGLVAAGIVEWYRWQPLVFVLAPKTTYRPDVLVALRGGPICAIEIKGGYRWKHNTIKYKLARELRQEYVWACFAWEKGKWHILFKDGTEPLDLLP